MISFNQIWGNAYPSNLSKLILHVLQKISVRIISRTNMFNYVINSFISQSIIINLTCLHLCTLASICCITNLLVWTDVEHISLYGFHAPFVMHVILYDLSINIVYDLCMTIKNLLNWIKKFELTLNTILAYSCRSTCSYWASNSFE